MKAILYCRKSTDTEDKQMMSLDAQENELKKIAIRDGIEIVKTYRESMSAKAPGRPLFAEMLGLISKGKADAILCWKLDRLARNPVDGGSISWMLQLNQIRSIKTHDREYLPTDNVLLMSVEFGMSNQYIRDLSENVKRGNREKLRRGEWPNRAPYGYKNDKNTKTLVIVRSQADRVREAYELYATGKYGMAELARKLNFGKSSLAYILSRSMYYGVMERDGEFFPGIHKPIITKELFDRVQQIKNGVTVTKPRPQKLFFPYRGFMKCAECGCQLTATRKKGRYDYYYCTNGKGFCSQGSLYLDRSKTDTFFTDALREIQFDEELIEIMYEAARERLENGAYDTQAVLDGIQLKLHQIKQRERKLLHSYTSGLIDETLYTEEASLLGKEKKELETQYRNYSQNTASRLDTLELTKNAFLEANKAVFDYQNASPEEKRNIIQNLLWNLEVKDKNVAQVSYKSPYSIMAKASKNALSCSKLPDLDSNQDTRYQKP